MAPDLSLPKLGVRKAARFECILQANLQKWPHWHFSGFEDGLRDREVDDVSSGGVSTTASLGGRSGTFESGFG
jgi:hypothetical protein